MIRIGRYCRATIANQPTILLQLKLDDKIS